MKIFYTLIILILFSLSSSAQIFSIYTARANGIWSNAATWSSVVRTDNVKKDKYFIPASFNVVTSSNFDYTTLGNVEVVVAGTLRLASNTIFALTANSTIDIYPGGKIESVGASAIFISNSLKYFSFASKTISGPAYTDVSIPGFASFTTLASASIVFTGSSADGLIHLNWSLPAQTGIHHFEVESSADGNDWKKTGEVYVNAATGAGEYHYTERNTAIRSYYRIRKVDNSGRSQYSTILMLNSAGMNLQVYAADRKINVVSPGSAGDNIFVHVLDFNGVTLKSQRFEHIAGRISMDVSELRPGTYFIQVSTPTKISSIKKVMVY